MGPMSDDDEGVARAAAATARSDSPRDPGAAVERGDPGGPRDPGDAGDLGDDAESVEEGLGLGMPAMEEAGYGHGV
jgi:hypothetical protein